MARPLRIEYPGAFYHITSRGNARQNIFLSHNDFNLFKVTLKNVTERYHWKCYAYCLMNNHYHLLIETIDGQLSLGMRHLNGVYTQKFNRRHQRVGHVFQGRFKAFLIEKESYLLELCRYIVLNPFRAGMESKIGTWRWSSYREMIGREVGTPLVEVVWVLAQFAKDKQRAIKAYQTFIANGVKRESFWHEVKGGGLLGGDEFVEEVKAHMSAEGEIKEIAKRDRFLGRKKLKDIIILDRGKEVRDKTIHQAHYEQGYTLAAIGRHAGMHYSTVSKICNGMIKIANR